MEYHDEIPPDFHFVYLTATNGEVIKVKDEGEENLIETMPGTEQEIPLDFHLVHIKTEEGDDIMRYIWTGVSGSTAQQRYG